MAAPCCKVLSCYVPEYATAKSTMKQPFLWTRFKQRPSLMKVKP